MGLGNSRRVAVACIVAAGTALTGAAGAGAATIDVTTDAPEVAADGQCSLSEAMRSANTDTAVGECPAGSGADTIRLHGRTITTNVPQGPEDEGFPDATSTITIAGGGATLARGAGATDEFRLLESRSGGNLFLSDLKITGGLRGDGGAAAVTDGGAMALSGVTLTGNRSNGSGGGALAVLGTGSSLAVSDSVIAGNESVNDAGAIEVYQGSLTLTGTEISSNQAGGQGGGVLARIGATVAVTGAAVSDNTAGGSGGGFYAADGATIAVTSATVSGNHAGGYGGALMDERGATITFSNGSLLGNHATNGAAVFAGATLNVSLTDAAGNTAADYGVFLFGSDSHGTVRDSTIHDNTGGAVTTHSGAAVALSQVTITANNGNTAFSRPGGIEAFGTTHIVADHLTVAGNSGDGQVRHSDPSVLSISESTVDGPGGCVGDPVQQSGANHEFPGTTCGFAVHGDPLLGPLQDNGGAVPTMLPGAGSPIVDAGASCPGADVRGIARPQDGDGDGTARCDLGATEVRPPTLSTDPAAGLEFGARRIGGAYTLPVTVTASDVTDERGLVHAATSGDGFSVDASDCAATLGEGESCTLHVTFAPTAVGDYSGTLGITGAGGPRTVGLHGRGIAGVLDASPDSVAFGSVHLGARATRTVTVTSTGEAPVRVTRSRVTGAASFSVASDGCAGRTLAQGQSCSVTVAFAPTAVGAQSATLSFDSDADRSDTVSLTGTGSCTLIYLGARLLGLPITICI
jgi:hypothetical protein